MFNRDSFYKLRLSKIKTWILNYISDPCGVQLLIHTLTLKSGHGWVTTSHGFTWTYPRGGGGGGGGGGGLRNSWWHHMMTSSNGNIFRVTGHLCGEFTGPGEFTTQRPVTRSFDVFFDLRNSWWHHMMTSSNGNIFRVTGHLCGEFTGPGEFTTQRPVTRSFDVFFDLRWTKGWANNRDAGDLGRQRAHHDVAVCQCQIYFLWSSKSFTLSQLANHLFIKINLLRNICTKFSHACCSLCR